MGHLLAPIQQRASIPSTADSRLLNTGWGGGVRGAECGSGGEVWRFGGGVDVVWRWPGHTWPGRRKESRRVQTPYQWSTLLTRPGLQHHRIQDSRTEDEGRRIIKK